MRNALKLRLLWPAAAAAFCVPACVAGGPDAPTEFDESETAEIGALLTEGSPEALGVLGFLNGPEATLTRLDKEIGLDGRAAKGIVAHVAGADGKRGTADDDPFGTIAELDAVKYVGPATIAKLLAWVASHGGVPDLVVESVPLTKAQAAAILAVANQATLAELDVDAGLDSRAAKKIVAARPIADMGALAKIAYVGTKAIQQLRDFAASWTAPPPPPPPPPPASPCGTTFEPVADELTAKLSKLLAIATTLDYPSAEVRVVRIPKCVNLVPTPELAQALYTAAFWDWEAGSLPPPEIGPYLPGGAQYMAALSTVRPLIQERIDGDLWAPQPGSEGAALWEELDGLVEALDAPVIDDPSEFVEVHLRFEASECSQDAVALILLRDGLITIWRTWPHC